MVKAPPPHPTYSAPISERLEAMLGNDPRTALDKLRAAQKETARLRDKEAEVASLLATYRARFSYPSHWEHERKALLARLASFERDRVLRTGGKVTEGALDQYAHSHGEYRDFLDQGKRERERMEELEAQFTGLRGQIEIGRGVETYYSELVRLNNALIYHSAREASLT